MFFLLWALACWHGTSRILHGDVLTIHSEGFAEAKINQIHLISLALDAHAEILWLDVSVDEVVVVQRLEDADHLETEQSSGLQGEALADELHQIHQVGTQ